MRVIVIFCSLFGLFSELLAAGNELLVSKQLIYVFSSGVEEHDFRAGNWSRLAEVSELEFAVLLFDRGKTELIDLPEFAAELASPYFFDKSTDYAVLLNPINGQVSIAGRGEEVEEILNARLAGSLTTDVDESTWGKIKELFQ